VTVIGLDDTDSRDRGMCTTHVAARLADSLRERDVRVERVLLVRLNPAVEHKTRGNAAIAVHADCEPALARRLAGEAVGEAAETADPKTHPGLVVAPDAPGDVPDPVATHARAALHERLEPDDARDLAETSGYHCRSWKEGRGLVGALAAVGAWRALDEWTYEHIAYRERERWGTDRAVDRDSVFAAADAAYPEVWDTVDREEGVAVCVPRTPCPVLYGIRGDGPDAVERVANRIESEPVADRETFVTNQGTDAHLRDVTLAAVDDGRSYRVDGTVASAPETRRGGHVFLSLARGDHTLRCAAFEPTKRFRDRVRALRPGDRITACGEVADGTLKLEKFAVRDLVETEPAVPACPDCGRSMESAGRKQGYRCRDCGTDADGKVQRPVERTLEPGWYEVPPCARRHVARPLVRGGFDAPVHPEK
jgi:tRNA(Ile2)-agmatinylcytidine synthase